VAFPIKDQCEPVRAGIFRQLLFLLGCFGRQLLEPGNNVVLDRGDQSRIDLLVDVQKWLAMHGIDLAIASFCLETLWNGRCAVIDRAYSVDSATVGAV